MALAMTGGLRADIGFIGVTLHLAASSLLAGLFLLLRRYSGRRGYFHYWSAAWLAITVAMGAWALSHFVEVPAGTRRGEEPDAIRALLVLYQFGRLAFVTFLVAGTVQYARGMRPERLLRYGLILAAVHAGISGVVTDSLEQIIVLQAPIAAACFGWCAWAVLTVPQSRRGVGALATGVAFLVMALLWSLYCLAFGMLNAAPWLQWALVYTTFLDVLSHMLVGFGMVVMLMEDGKREGDDAQAELRVAHDHLSRAAYYDVLTGALNRRAFQDKVGIEHARASQGAVIIVDLDDFKSVNDTYGHAAGDALLAHVAESVRPKLRPSDKLYRWGGDEFLLLLPGADLAGAHARLNAVLAAAPPLEHPTAPEPIPIRASTGAAAYASGDDLDEAIAAADTDMYRSKGRSRSAPALATR
jgi:diguanylate cyclase (GGDEF)-like protein